MIEPYFRTDDGAIALYHGDCLDVLPQLGAEVADVAFCDPPWGVNKADWDGAFGLTIVEAAARATRTAIAVTPGIVNLLRLPQSIGEMTYRWTLSVRIANGMTRGAIGFGNWIAVPVYARATESIYACAQDATEIVIRGSNPDHPDPKPLDAMRWILSRLPSGTVLDPTCGSGTTLLAAREQGRRAIGIEREESHCETAAIRLGSLPKSASSIGPLFSGGTAA
jgi:site-specific DNA-methyltransferase (adenine-specific)